MEDIKDEGGSTTRQVVATEAMGKPEETASAEAQVTYTADAQGNLTFKLPGESLRKLLDRAKRSEGG